MAEILLEGRDCEKCGTEIRKAALFCYHCGASVAPDVVVTTDTKDEKVSDAWFREDAAASVPKDEKTVDDAKTIEKKDESKIAPDTEESEIVEDEIVEVETETIDEEAAFEKDAKEKADEKPKLKSAAAMRRKSKRIQKKRVEIVWDEPNSPPNIWFLIATLLFAVLAVGLWFVANYLG